MSQPKVYLGDSVYAQYDGFGFILTTENGAPGDDPSNTIYLEPDVLEALIAFSTTFHPNSFNEAGH